MRKTVNMDASPVVGVVSAPTRLPQSAIWAARRTIGETLTSDSTSGALGSADAQIIKEAIQFRRWWVFAGGAFHFSITDIPLTTVLALATLKLGTIVGEAPEALKFRAVVSPLGMTNSAIFTLASVIERLVRLHADMQEAGFPPFQLMEMLPLGSATDIEFLIPCDQLLTLCESVLERKDTLRSDVMLPDLVRELLDRASDVVPDIFIAVKEAFYA